MALRTNPRSRRIMTFVLFGILGLSVLLPSGFYALYTWMPTAIAEEPTNPRADYWRNVRQGDTENAYTTLNSHDAGTVLINSSGQNWRQLRNGPLATYGGILLVAAVVGILVFYLLRGRIKLQEARTGVKIQRWHMLERGLHWIVAAGFFLLAVTGLSLLFGRALLIPLLGKEAFAMYAQVAHQIHHWVGPFFVLFLVIMLLVWLKNNFFTHIDVRWFAQGGGIVGKAHPSAEFMNAGEKLWYWVVFFAGLSVAITGLILYLPIFGQTRGDMQLAHLLHAGVGVVWIAFSLGHVYIATLGTEGALEGMVSGDVDESWAKQHHDLWFEEVKTPRSTS